MQMVYAAVSYDRGSKVPVDAQTLAVCALVLYLKFLATTMIQGRRGFDAGTRVPEDNELPQAKGKPNQSFDYRLDHPDEVVRAAVHDELRWKRVVQNDLEAIPLALLTFLIATTVGANVNVNTTAIIVFTIARIVHTLAYVNKRPLVRMLAWIGGVLSILVSSISGVVAVAK